MKTLTAVGSIETSIFVTMDSVGADFSVKKAVANTHPYGISGAGSRQAPLPVVTDDPTIHAIAGEPCQVHRPSGDEQDSTVMLRLGGTVTRGAKLMPDANGYGIVATTGKNYGAIADQSGVSGDIIRVTPEIGLVA